MTPGLTATCKHCDQEIFVGRDDRLFHRGHGYTYCDDNTLGYLRGPQAEPKDPLTAELYAERDTLMAIVTELTSAIVRVQSFADLMEQYGTRYAIADDGLTYMSVSDGIRESIAG